MDASFAIGWLWLLFVSVSDGYWVWRCREAINEYDQNRIGRLRLAANAGEVALFWITKTVGTVLTSLCLLVVYLPKPQLGLSIVLMLATIQLCLPVFLNYFRN
jgi:hypothetical protein